MKNYNLDQLNEMAQGSSDFVEQMIQVFLEHVPAVKQDMKAQFAAGNLSKVGELAHQIKPSIDLMGISALYEDIRNLERLGKTNTIDGMNELIIKVDEILDSVFQDLPSELQQS